MSRWLSAGPTASACAWTSPASSHSSARAPTATGGFCSATRVCGPLAAAAEAPLVVLVGAPARADLGARLPAFFDNKPSPGRVAERVGVHETPTGYRLSRVEQLTGLPVTHDPDA